MRHERGTQLRLEYNQKKTRNRRMKNRKWKIENGKWKTKNNVQLKPLVVLQGQQSSLQSGKDKGAARSAHLSNEKPSTRLSNFDASPVCMSHTRVSVSY